MAIADAGGHMEPLATNPFLIREGLDGVEYSEQT